MRKLIRFLKGYEKESIIAPLFKMTEASFELFVPIVMANIIDIGINNKDMNYILKMGAILLLLGVLGLACSATAQYFSAKAAVGFGTKLRHAMFEHIQNLSYSEIDLLGSSTLVTRITSDINQAQAGVNLVLRLLLRAPFIVIGALIMAFTIHPQIALIFLVATVGLGLIIYLIVRFTLPMYKGVQSYLDKVLQTTRENISGIRVVRAFRTQKAESKEFEKENDTLMYWQMKVGDISALMNPLTYVFVNLAIVLIIWKGADAVDTGVLTQGQVLALVNYMTQILLALIVLSVLIIAFTKALASAVRINEVFSYTSSIKDGSEEDIEKQTQSKIKVKMENVALKYATGKEEVLSNISFTAKEGETIGIIGGTGSGKTSLVNLIPRFYDVSDGMVLVNGENVKSYKYSKLREKIGVVPQKSVLFHGTIRENMQFGNALATDKEIEEALCIAQAAEVVAGKKGGLDAKISEGGRNLSGGQRQRLAIARALVRKPEILILDDSASALDFATDAKLRAAILESTKRMTVFIVSQRASSIMHANQIIVLDNGEVLGIGEHKKLLETCEIYKEICHSQLSKEEIGV